jgi:hypothetical protein
MGMNSSKYKTFNIHESTSNEVYNKLNEEFDFNFDPCPLHSEVDGLSISWQGNVFVNPPYGKAIRGWLEKGLNEIEVGNVKSIVYLLPSYTDVKWFHEIAIPFASEIRFIKGRLKFGFHNKHAPFASVLLIFRGH